MKSVLPADLEAVRVKIARTHNLLTVLLLVLYFGAMFGLLQYAPQFLRQDTWKPLLLGLAGVFAGILLVVRFDDYQCRRLGFMCPKCGKPLHESRSAFYWMGSARSARARSSRRSHET